jgi:hypothetical protein
LQNGCDIPQHNVFSSPIMITHEGDALAWMDPKAAKGRADQGYKLRVDSVATCIRTHLLIRCSVRILYREEADQHALTYCATVEHQGNKNYVACPTPLATKSAQAFLA